jgi:hypothetical protein
VLSGREKNEMISMITTNHKMYQGTPDGTNSFKNFKPFLAMPTVMTVKNTISAIVAVMMIWLVGVKKYGNMPSMFAAKMKRKSVNTNGKKRFTPSSPAASFTIE